MGFTMGRLVLLSLSLLIFFGLTERVLDRMYMRDKTAILIVVLMIVGSFVNVTLYSSDTITVCMNLGGALIPFAVAV